MSDTPQGPGWWQASDDKWYPPPRPEMPSGEALQPPYGDPGGQQIPPSGPYGAPPSMASGSYGGMPPGQHSNRTAIFVGLGVAGVLLLLLGMFLVFGGDDDSDDDATLTSDTSVPTDETLPPDNTDPQEPAEPTEPAGGGGGDDTGGGGTGGSGTGAGGEVPSSFSSTDPVELENGLQVVEHGFSSTADYYGDDIIQASYGVILENTGDSLQEEVTLIVTAKAEDGSTLGSENHDIHFVDAGQTMAIGHVFDDAIAPIAELEFSFGGSTDGGSLGSGTTEVTSVTTTDDGSSLSVTFGVDNNHNFALEYPYTTAILRDSSGGVIGGDSSIIALPSDVPAGSSSGGDMTLWMAFEETDINLDATELYVYYRP